MGGVARVQGFEGEAEREEIKDEGDEFLIDVCERDPVLAVAREDEHEQRGDEGGGLAVGKDLREHPPCGETERKADDEREDLPRQRMNRNQAGGDVEDRSEKRAEGREGGRELGGTEELRDPREGPVIPVETCDGEEGSVGDDGEDGDEDDVMFCGGAKRH